MNIHQIYRPILTYFRKKRLKKFYSFFQITEESKLLDIGGNLFFGSWPKMKGTLYPRLPSSICILVTGSCQKI